MRVVIFVELKATDQCVCGDETMSEEKLESITSAVSTALCGLGFGATPAAPSERREMNHARVPGSNTSSGRAGRSAFRARDLGLMSISSDTERSPLPANDPEDIPSFATCTPIVGLRSNSPSARAVSHGTLVQQPGLARLLREPQPCPPQPRAPRPPPRGRRVCREAPRFRAPLCQFGPSDATPGGKRAPQTGSRKEGVCCICIVSFQLI